MKDAAWFVAGWAFGCLVILWVEGWREGARNLREFHGWLLRPRHSRSQARADAALDRIVQRYPGGPTERDVDEVRRLL